MIQDQWEKKLTNPVFRSVRAAIEAGLTNIRKWYRRMDDTDVYILSMVLNPVIKLAFIRVSWDNEYVKSAEEVVNKAVSNFFRLWIFSLIILF